MMLTVLYSIEVEIYQKKGYRKGHDLEKHIQYFLLGLGLNAKFCLDQDWKSTKKMYLKLWKEEAFVRTKKGKDLALAGSLGPPCRKATTENNWAFFKFIEDMCLKVHHEKEAPQWIPNYTNIVANHAKWQALLKEELVYETKLKDWKVCRADAKKANVKLQKSNNKKIIVWPPLQKCKKGRKVKKEKGRKLKSPIFLWLIGGWSC